MENVCGKSRTLLHGEDSESHSSEYRVIYTENSERGTPRSSRRRRAATELLTGYCP